MRAGGLVSSYGKWCVTTKQEEAGDYHSDSYVQQFINMTLHALLKTCTMYATLSLADHNKCPPYINLL